MAVIIDGGGSIHHRPRRTQKVVKQVFNAFSVTIHEMSPYDRIIERINIVVSASDRDRAEVIAEEFALNDLQLTNPYVANVAQLANGQVMFIKREKRDNQ
jgi:hypothetical protein